MITERETFFKKVKLINSDFQFLSAALEFKEIPGACSFIYEMCQCLNQPTNPDANYLLETKRLVYGVVPVALLRKPDADLKLVEQLHQELLELGFSTLEERFSVEFSFVNFFLKNNLHIRAKSIVDELFSKLEKSQSDDSNMLAKYQSKDPNYLRRKKLLFECLFEKNHKTEKNEPRNFNVPQKDLDKFLSHANELAQSIRSEKIFMFFDAVQKFCMLLEVSQNWKLELKRQVAEIKLKLLTERNVDFTLIDQLHNEMLELGFRDLERESTIQIFFAKYCIRQMKFNPARSTLQKLHSKLDEALTEENKPEYAELKSQVENLLSEIPKNG